MPHPIDPKLLQCQSPWLRRLALELVGNRHPLEGALQETWLAAPENPAATPPDEPGLRKGLARVLRL